MGCSSRARSHRRRLWRALRGAAAWAEVATEAAEAAATAVVAAAAKVVAAAAAAAVAAHCAGATYY